MNLYRLAVVASLLSFVSVILVLISSKLLNHMFAFRENPHSVCSVIVEGSAFVGVVDNIKFLDERDLREYLRFNHEGRKFMFLKLHNEVDMGTAQLSIPLIVPLLMSCVLPISWCLG